MQQCMRLTSTLKSGHQYQQQKQGRTFGHQMRHPLYNCFLYVTLGGDWKYEHVLFIYLFIYLKLYKGSLFVKE